VIGPDGVLWWTTGQATGQLHVDRKRLNDWVRRSAAAGHWPGAQSPGCPGCARPSFPHVDPPVRRGRVAGYRAEQLMDAEAHTANAARGGALRTDA
jgi:hypothetical protein